MTCPKCRRDVRKEGLCPYCVGDEGVVALVSGVYGTYAVARNIPSSTTWGVADAGDLGSILVSTAACCVWAGTRIHPVSLAVVQAMLETAGITPWIVAYLPPSKIGCEVWVKKENYQDAQRRASRLLTESLKGSKIKEPERTEDIPTEMEDDIWLP